MLLVSQAHALSVGRTFIQAPKFSSIWADQERRASLYEEISDILSQVIQLHALNDEVIRITEGGDITFPAPGVQAAFVSRKIMSPPEAQQQADAYWEALKGKYASGRKPWQENALTPLQHYATRAGDEFRELVEVLNDQRIARGTSVPVNLAPDYPLLRVAQAELLADRKEVAQKLLQYVGTDGKLTPQFLAEMDRIWGFSLQKAAEYLGPTYTLEEFLPFMVFKLNTRTNVDRQEAKRREREFLLSRVGR